MWSLNIISWNALTYAYHTSFLEVVSGSAHRVDSKGSRTRYNLSSP